MRHERANYFFFWPYYLFLVFVETFPLLTLHLYQNVLSFPFARVCGWMSYSVHGHLHESLLVDISVFFQSLHFSIYFLIPQSNHFKSLPLFIFRFWAPLQSILCKDYVCGFGVIEKPLLISQETQFRVTARGRSRLIIFFQFYLPHFRTLTMVE